MSERQNTVNKNHEVDKCPWHLEDILDDKTGDNDDEGASDEGGHHDPWLTRIGINVESIHSKLYIKRLIVNFY